MTILAQDDIAGLQVMNLRGMWVEVPPIPDTFVINISDLMQRSTNDAYLANLHRVVNVSGGARYSMPCFVDCDFTAEIAPLPNFISDAVPYAYAPMQCGLHKLSRYKASFPHLAAL
jgi:isopenicillin N synthase-like dioxygenase